MDIDEWHWPEKSRCERHLTGKRRGERHWTVILIRKALGRERQTREALDRDAYMWEVPDNGQYI